MMTGLEYFWFFIMPVVGMIMLAVFPITLLLIWFRYFHPTARKLNSFIRKKMVIFIDAYDTGKVYFKALRERKGAAIGRTVDKSYRLLPKLKTKLKGEEKKEAAEEKDEKKDADGDRTEEILAEAVSKRFFLEDTGCPIFLGHGGTLCLTNPEVLALVEQAKSPNPTVIKGDDDKERILIDPRRLEELIPKNYDESQLNAVINDIWMIARAEKGLGQFVIPIAAIAIVAFIAIIGIQVLGRFLGIG